MIPKPLKSMCDFKKRIQKNIDLYFYLLALKINKTELLTVVFDY